MNSKQRTLLSLMRGAMEGRYTVREHGDQSVAHGNTGRKPSNAIFHRHRERRPCFGELLQADATPYDWLGTGERFALHGFIDDATSRITALYMSKNECLPGYLEALRATLGKYGLPMELYTDRFGIFSVNGKGDESKDMDGNDIRKTQGLVP